MKNLKQLYTDLEKYKNFDEGDNTENFLDTVAAVLELQDAACIPELLKYVEEQTDYDWIFEILQNNIFYLFKHSDGAKFFIEALKDVLGKAPHWAEDTVSIIFNDEDGVKLFRANMHLAPKSSLLELFSIMEEESPHHRELIQELRKELEKS